MLNIFGLYSSAEGLFLNLFREPFSFWGEAILSGTKELLLSLNLEITPGRLKASMGCQGSNLVDLVQGKCPICCALAPIDDHILMAETLQKFLFLLFYFCTFYFYTFYNYQLQLCCTEFFLLMIRS